ncbi:uncharacterized protein Z518_10161 [Rhinocladiella mackenziei CBS 650.93]|uniref:Uncharacterized protein n=1 Tax=Rhinocladiella mackenziei CBS 650.93 TaxID=1442369 RepID=A0A0D2IWV1_9EURO|nr:uncharacterized protein Z518_10161 [Rhinocladiella mackenziei CBS 650.93]KIX01095.1 hypothetical protein Z518_10161 [Rhinocladiella mackenziei CBS 650.93]
MTSSSIDVAVIGLGALGLVALKNLREEGFNATGFERNTYVGGLWQFTEAKQTSVLESTIVNISKERTFLFQKASIVAVDHLFNPPCWTNLLLETNSYASAADVQKYLADYMAHFQLQPHVQLGVNVLSVTRDEQNHKWVLNVTRNHNDSNLLTFDKVIVATGTNHTPVVPTLKGQELFHGQILHSRDFKRPSDYKDKRVMVVSIGNSAADTSTSLVGIAKKIFLSHRHGAYILPRSQLNGQPFDHGITYRKTMMSLAMQRYAPRLFEIMSNKMLQNLQNASFKLKPEWAINPAPSLVHNVPTVTDTLIPALEKDEIESVEMAKEITGNGTVELADGKVVEVDTIIWCTGYHVDYSVVGEFDPILDTRHTDVSDGAFERVPPPTTPAAQPKKFDPPVPRLYQNLLSLTHPDSLAFLGTAAIPSAAFQIYDLATMAIAQLWKPDPSSPSLPSRPEMITWVRDHLAWANAILARGSFNTRMVRAPDWNDWLNETSGSRVNEYLGYGLQGWAFWLQDRKFCNLLMDGIYSPHVYRLFDSYGRRKAWAGAREAIISVNEEAERTLKELLQRKKNELR